MGDRLGTPGAVGFFSAPLSVSVLNLITTIIFFFLFFHIFFLLLLRSFLPLSLSLSLLVFHSLSGLQAEVFNISQYLGCGCSVLYVTFIDHSQTRKLLGNKHLVPLSTAIPQRGALPRAFTNWTVGTFKQQGCFGWLRSCFFDPSSVC